MSGQFLPALPELPVLVDAKVKGLRLQGTLAKALPPMANVGSMTNVRQMEAEQYANDIRAAFEISRQYDKRSKALARAKIIKWKDTLKNLGYVKLGLKY